MQQLHISVLGPEAPRELVRNVDGLYIDATFGRGGHSRRILDMLSSKGRLVAFDRDPQAVAAADQIKDPRFSIIHAPFSEMKERLAQAGIYEVDGILMDIGVSSPQIDEAERGFSFRMDGPLDMRMDTTSGITAAQWIAEASEQEIKRVVSTYGEEKFAHLIARAIVRERVEHPIETTKQLADLVARVVPKNKKDAGQNPATRTFQAIRIEINQELEELRRALEASVHLLKPQGRLAVITFHSLEDRLVKRFYEKMAHPERELDPRLPIPADKLPKPVFVDVERIKPGRQECEVNPRARSAFLRTATRTEVPFDGGF